MTKEQYYWNIYRPQMLRHAIAGFAEEPIPQPQICEVTFEGTNCRCKIDGEESFHKIITIGSDVTVEVIPNEGYFFTKWADGETANPRTWHNVQSDFIAKAGVYEDFGPLCFSCEGGFGMAITLKSRESGKENTPVNDICPGLNLQYSSDGINWNVYDMTKKPSQVALNLSSGSKLYFKAITSNPNGFGNNLYFHTDALDPSGIKLTLSGSVMYLLDSTGKTRSIPENGFNGLFAFKQSVASVSFASMPKIPADNLGNNCCKEMFKDCHKLCIYRTDAVGRTPWQINASGIIGENWNFDMVYGTGGDSMDHNDPVNTITYYI